MKILKTKIVEVDATESDVEEIVASVVDELISGYSDEEYNEHVVREVLLSTLEEFDMTKCSEEEFDKMVTIVQNKYLPCKRSAKTTSLKSFNNREKIINWINHCLEFEGEVILTAEDVLDAILENGGKK